MNEDFVKQLDCMRPHSPCWCEQHPNSNHPKCRVVSVPIDSSFYTIIVMFLGIQFVFRKIKNKIKFSN